MFVIAALWGMIAFFFGVLYCVGIRAEKRERELLKGLRQEVIYEIPPEQNDFELVIIESPFAKNEEHSEEEHVTYARRCMHDCLLRGEAPFASHLLYTQPNVLDDSIPEERELGMKAGFAYRNAIKKTVVYEDYGISRGMKEGVDNAKAHLCEVERRKIGKNPV
jgi:hypothetical protein